MSIEDQLQASPEEEQFFEEQKKASLTPEEPEEPSEDPPELGEERTNDEPEDGESQETEENVEPEKPPKGYVPLGALHEERNQRKALQQEIEQMRGQFGEVHQLKSELEQWRQQKHQQEQQLNDEEAYNADPIGYLRNQNQRLQDQLNGFSQSQQEAYAQQQQAVKQQQMLQNVVTTVRGHEDEYRQQVPDYDDAFNFLQNKRMNDYDTLGVTDPGTKQQNFYQEVLSVSVQALQNGMNPAEVMYKLANQWGFSGTKAGQQKIESAKRGQKAATTLSQGGGSGNTAKSKISLTDIDNMSDEEFDKYWDQMHKDNKRG